ncbi:MAG: hypothetical protein ACTS4U_00285 [Candidatus Hodgkinia cicadicola]
MGKRKRLPRKRRGREGERDDGHSFCVKCAEGGAVKFAFRKREIRLTLTRRTWTCATHCA